MILLSVGALVGLTLWLQSARRVRPELAPLVASSIVLLSMYGAALAGWLAGGLWGTYGVCFALAASAIPRLQTLSREEWQASGAVNLTFIALAVAAWAVLSDGRFNTWDEFSHWGRVSKAISVEGALPTSSTGILLHDYPPGAALFQYFVLAGRFSEGGTYVAQALFLAAAGLAVTSWRGLRGLHLFVGSLVAVGLMLLILGLGFATVEIDHLLGAVFGAAVSAYMLSDHRDSRTAVALVPVVSVLPLIKPIGLVFALCATAVIALDRVITLFDRGTKNSARRWVWFALSLFVVVAPLIVHQSWQRHVTNHGFTKTFDLHFSADRLAALVFPSRRTDPQTTTVRAYTQALDLAPIGRLGNGSIYYGRWNGVPLRDLPPPASARQWFWGLLLMSIVALFLRANETWRTHVIAHAAVAVGCLAYLALLLYAYLFAFGAYEGPRVISFGRYAGPWFLAWMFVVLATVGNTTTRSKLREMAAVLILVSVFAWGIVRVRAQPEAEVLNARAGVQAVVARVEASLPQGAKTYLIWQGTYGLEFHLMAYELTPRRTNAWCWAIGEKFAAHDVWTCPLSPKEWADALADYEFVLIGHADEAFWTRYRPLFAPGASDVRRDLYRIVRSERGVVLEPTSAR